MLRNPRKTLAYLAICLAATIVGVLIWKGVGRRPDDRVYRIGWDSDPPYQVLDTDGRPTGLAIELVREAAKRRGVRLEWIRLSALGTIAALREGRLDLWPLLTITPERKEYIYFTDPYLEGAHCFLVRADSAYTKTQDLAGALISHNSVPINVRNLHLVLPKARFLANRETTEAMESVCQNRADAAFVEEYAALAAVLGGLSCSGEKLRLVPAPEIRPRMSVASSFASRAAADAIRDGIGEIASDSQLPPVLRRWSYFSRRNIESLQNLQEAKRVQRLLIIFVAVLLSLLLTAAWLTGRTLRAQRNARRAEKELDVTQRNYQLLTEQAAEGVFQMDQEGRFLVVNSRICEMLGYTAEEMRHMTVLDTYFPAELETGRQRLAAVFSGAGLRVERAMRRKDGTGIPMEASVINLGGGRAQGIVHDISDRLNAEAALRDSEERLRLAQQAARVGSFEWDMRTGVDRWTPELEEMYGLPRGGFPGTQDAWAELVHPEDLPAVERRLAAAMEAGSFDGEFRIIWPDGSVRWIAGRASVLKDESGDPARLVGINIDITDRKNAEAALKESEERFRNMADSAPVLLWISGPDKVLNFFNKTWLDFVGRTLEQELNNGWVQSLHPHDVDQCFASYSTAFDARERFHIECRMRRSDGEYRWMLCSGIPRYGADGSFAGYIGTDIDITDLRRAQEEAVARQKLESLGVLAGGIAHDFNNLLGSILMNAELVLSQLPASSPAVDDVETIRTVASRAAEIVTQMMAYAGKESAEFEPVDVSKLVGEMLQLLKISITKRAVLKVSLPEKLPAVSASATQLRQVVMNLIMNASEAIGEKDGCITVATSEVRMDGAFGGRAAGASAGDYLRLAVSDTGCGMTDEVRARMFDPFFTTKLPGRGLGLSAVQGIIRSHGGTINVVSAPGCGSSFEILLPCSSEAGRVYQDRTLPEAVNGHRGGGSVLVIEDEDALRITVSKVLRKNGFTVFEAATGKEGAEMFGARASTIDAVLLDMTLPEMSGPEVLSALRQIQPDVKVVITSAYSQGYVRTATAGQEPCQYIRKPYQPGELIGLLRSVCLDEQGRSSRAVM